MNIKHLLVGFVLKISGLNVDSVDPNSIIPIIYGSSHIYLMTTESQPITIPCKPSFYAIHQQTVALYKILSINLTEQIIIGDSNEFGSVTYDNRTGYHFSWPHWTVYNTRLMCLITDLREQTDGSIVSNLPQYIKYFVNVTDIDFGIKELKISNIEPNNQYSILKSYGDIDIVQLRATIVEPTINYVDITWYKDNREILIPIYMWKIIGNEISLEISNYTLSDSGVFTVTARTIKSFINVSWTMIVDEPVKTDLILSENQVTFSKGLNYTLKCSVRLMQIGSLPNITWYSAPCIDPINTDCVGDLFIPNWTQIHISETDISRNNSSQQYEISSTIKVSAHNTTYQCIIDQIWSANNDRSDKQVQQKLMFSIDVPENQLNNSSFVKMPAQIISEVKGNKLELKCRVNIGLYANNISFYYREIGSEQMILISTINTKDKINTSIGYFEKMLIKDNPKPGLYACKFRKRGSNHYNELYYTFNSSPSMKINIFLILCILIPSVMIIRF